MRRDAATCAVRSCTFPIAVGRQERPVRRRDLNDGNTGDVLR